MNKNTIQKTIKIYSLILIFISFFSLMWYIYINSTQKTNTSNFLVLLYAFFDTLKLIVTPLVGFIILKLQVNLSFLGFDLTKKKTILEDSAKTLKLKAELVSEIDKIIKYDSFYERLWAEDPTGNSNVEKNIHKVIEDFKVKIPQNNNILIDYYNLIEDTKSIQLFETISQKIIEAETILVKMDLNGEKTIKELNTYIDFINKTNVKYKNEILSLILKEINEIPSWDSFKILLLEIKNQLNNIN